MENTQPPQKENIFDNIRRNWFLIVFIGGMIMAWSNLGSKIDYLETRVTKLEQIAETQAKSTSELTGAIIEIKSNYLFIKEKLEKLDK